MEEQGIGDFFLTHKKYLFPLLISLVGLGCILFGIITLIRPSQQQDISIEHAETSTPEVKAAEISASPVPKQLVIDVEGAVQKPGVYHIAADSRIQDALAVAGGLLKAADQNKVAKSLNLAAKLSDGSKLYIPFAGEESDTPVSMINNSGGERDSNGPVNINTASASELDTLPGVGKVTADKIIANRPYSSAEELVSKKVMTSKVFSNLREQITIY